MMTLSRHERSVNTLSFSPDGYHLATAGDGGSIIIWSLPLNNNDKNQPSSSSSSSCWQKMDRPNELSCRVLPSSSEDILSLSWSSDSKRFVVGSLDHCVSIYEQQNQQQQLKQKQKPKQQQWNWKCVYRNNGDHGQYVQGVAFDPMGAYVASQGSDRTVRVRMIGGEGKKRKNRGKLLLDVGKARVLKWNVESSRGEQAESGSKRHYLFADESTVESFFRRLCWSTDGAFLIVPTALWYGNNNQDGDGSSLPTFATYLYARHQFDKPYKVLPGLEKPSVVIRPNPILFRLPSRCPKQDALLEHHPLPYRSIFAVLTLDSIILYDTFHTRPLCIAKGLHYASLTDCSWSSDGHHLMVTSADGYVSILSFEDGELGEVYQDYQDSKVVVEQTESSCSVEGKTEGKVKDDSKCEKEEENKCEVVDNKKKKKKRIQPTLISCP